MLTTWDELFPAAKPTQLGLNDGEALDIEGVAGTVQVMPIGSRIVFAIGDTEAIEARLRKKWGTPFEEKVQVLWLGDGWRVGLRAGTRDEEDHAYLEVVPFTSVVDTVKKLITRQMPTVGSKRAEVVALVGAEERGALITVPLGPTEISDASSAGHIEHELDAKGVVMRVGVITNMGATSKTMENLVRLHFTGKPKQVGKKTVYTALGLTCEVAPGVVNVRRA